MKVFFIVLSFALQAFSSYGLERISQQRDGGLNFYLSDGQGSIRMLTDESGEVTDEYGFTAFGEELYKSGTTENRFGYTGEAFDAGLGYQYLRARWMDNSTGRFLGMDAYSGDPMAPVSLHRYLYANQSPLSMSALSNRPLIETR